MNKVLIINNDPQICHRLKLALCELGNDAVSVPSVMEAIERLVRENYQLVILDLSPSEEDSLRLLQVIQKLRPMPVLVLSSQEGTGQTVRALSLGADDVMKKPYDLEECLARAQHLLRRAVPVRAYTLVAVRDIVIDPIRRRAYQRGHPLELTRREFDLLSFLLHHAGQVLTRDQLLEQVWPGELNLASEEAVRYQIRQLRKKLGGGDDEVYIETVWGLGYRFKEE